MIKKLYEFNVLEEQTVVEKTTSTNEKGETVTIEKPVKKQALRKFIFKRPNRKQFDEAEIFQGARISEYIKKGCLTRKQLEAKFNNEGTTVSEREKEDYKTLGNTFFEIEQKLKFLGSIKESDRTEEQKKEFEAAANNAVFIKTKMQEMELEQLSLYDHTAENIARNRTILWWVFELAYQEINGKPEPLYRGTTYEEKDSQYSAFEEEDKTTELLATRRFLLLSSFCLARQWSITTDDIDAFAKEINLSDVLPEAPAEVKPETKAEVKIEKPV